MIQTAHAHEEKETALTGGRDPHIWLDPNRVKIQARTIRDALSATDPVHQADYAENCRAFEERLTHLDQELRQILSRASSKYFMVYHPSWGYFAQAYGLEQVPIEVEGKEPGPRSLAGIIDRARRDKVKAIFVQKQASARSAQVVAQAVGARVVLADDVPADYFGELRRLAHALAGDQP